jgi:hypothetical protein
MDTALPFYCELWRSARKLSKLDAVAFQALNLVLVICLVLHLATARLKREACTDCSSLFFVDDCSHVASPVTLPGWTCPLDIAYASRSIFLTQFSAPVVYESIIFTLTSYRVYESCLYYRSLVASSGPTL